MALGDGCWSPGIHWDGENSAALTGPRAGAWPYSGTGCTVADRNGMRADTTLNKLWTDPPMGVNLLSGAWAQDTAGASPAASAVLAPSANVGFLLSGGALPTLAAPAYSCEQPGCWDRLLLTADLTIGTGSTAKLQSDQTGAGGPAGYVHAFVNTGTVPTIAGTANRNTGLIALTWVPATSNAQFSDDPYGLNAVNATGPFAGSYLTVPAHSDRAVAPWNNSTNWTVSWWAKPRVLAATGARGLAGVPLSVDGGTNNMVTLGQTPGDATRWTLSNTVSDTGGATRNTYLLPSGSHTVGAWHHLAIVMTGSSAQVYVNGTLALTQALTTWLPTALTVGAVNPGSSNFWDGNLANVMIYQSALTSTQIGVNYNTPKTPTSGALVWWPLSDGANQQRSVRTVTIPRAYLYAAGGGNVPQVNLRMFHTAGSNAHVINSWAMQLISAFYDPAQLTI